MLKRCLQGEEVQLDVQGVRERVLRIGRVAQIVREGDVIAADICARWLLGTFVVLLVLYNSILTPSFPGF